MSKAPDSSRVSAGIIQSLLLRLSQGFPDTRGRDLSGADYSVPVLVSLRRHQPVRLEKDSGLTRIEVHRGMVWLTGTPGRSDQLLSSGETVRLTEDWPFVVEALEDAEVFLAGDR
jgi:hypothetical protein